MSGPEGLRVLTYNVRDLRDDQAALVRVIKAIQPDVACLQEVPRRPLSGHRVGHLADACGLMWAGGLTPSGGTAILTSPRVHVHESRGRRLPVSGFLTRPRGFVAAEVSIPGGRRLTVVCVHLGLDGAERAGHARLVGAALRDGATSPYVVCGDLNEDPAGPAATAMAASLGQPLVDLVGAEGGPTYPARSPRQRIDAILATGEVRRVGAPSLESDLGLSAADLAAASDHRPVVADLARGSTTG